MRILHIAQTIAGGIASYFEEIAPFQTRQFGPSGVRFLIPAGNAQHFPSIPSLQVVEFSPPDRSLRGLLSLSMAVRRELRNFVPTIVHLHSSFAGAVARPVIFALAPREVRVIYCPQGWSFGMDVPLWKRSVYLGIERCLASLTHAIVNVSRAEYELALSHGFHPKKLVVIRNGIAADPPCGPVSLSDGDPGTIHLVFVGRHDRQKGLDLLLEVFCSIDLPRVHLHVVGAPVLASGDIAHPARRLPNVTFYGWQPRTAVSNLISGADAVVMPSRWEGLPHVALEAMRLSKPVIASRRAPFPEIVGDGRTGMLFELERPRELRSILQRLDKDVLARMGRAARADFLREFTSDRLNAELLDLYQTSVGQAPTRHGGREAGKNSAPDGRTFSGQEQSLELPMGPGRAQHK